MTRVPAENPVRRVGGRSQPAGTEDSARSSAALRSVIAFRDAEAGNSARWEPGRRDGGAHARPTQLPQMVSFRRGGSKRPIPWCARFRQLCARTDDEAHQPWVRRRRARAPAAQLLFRPGSPSQAISDCGNRDSTRGNTRPAGVVSLIYDNHVIQALSTDRANQPFHVG
jgi:hypothetical protein